MWITPALAVRGRRLQPARLVIAITLGIVVATAVGVALVGFLAVAAVDQKSLERQRQFATRGIEERYHRLPTEQESSAIWDEAVLRVKQNDTPWIEENLGVWMGTYFGHDRVYVLDQADEPIYAMRDETSVAPSVYAEDRPIVQPLVEGLRAKMAEASEGQDDSTEAIAELGAEDYLWIGNEPALVSVKPIIPSTPALTQKPGTEYLHVAVVMIDAGYVEAIARQYDLADARFSTGREPGSPAAVPIKSADGETLGFFEWRWYRPGLTVLEGVAPSLAIASLPLGGLLFFLLLYVWRSTTALERSEREARFQALHDALTGLPNRTLFDDRLEHALAASRRSGRALAILLIDIDRFKQVNDTQGHPAGDELVREIGARLVALVRASDTVARLGGDEFAVLTTDVADAREAERLADRILREARHPFDLHGEQTFVSVSIGIHVCRGSDTTSADALRRADIALYEAKARGRRRYSVFAHGMDEVLLRRRTIEKDLHAALEDGGQLQVMYQPLHATGHATIVGAEALVRWNHPVHGMLSPGVFIGIAEERGLVEALGRLVLEDACRTALAIGLPWVAVNVSPVQLKDEGFAETVLDTLTTVGLDPPRLQLEITESALIEDDAVICATLTQLRDAGVRISLDDFGTGYASISYLRRYPVDKIKIDRSFVRQLGSSAEGDAIVRAIVALARAMKKRVAAEGVETIEQRDHLAALGCHELQGFLLSRPMSAAELKELLRVSPVGPMPRMRGVAPSDSGGTRLSA